MSEKLDVGGSPAAPYFGEGGREDAARKARLRRTAKEKGAPTGVTVGPAEAAKEPALAGDRTPAENVAKRDPASTKAEDFDTKSKSAVEVGAGEPFGDPVVDQAGTKRGKGGVDNAVTTSTSVVEKRKRGKKK